MSEFLDLALGYIIDIAAALVLSVVLWFAFYSHKFWVLVAAVFVSGIFIRFHTIFAVSNSEKHHK